MKGSRKIKMELNEKLQQLRKQKGWTQEEVAEMLYVSRTAISKWESGRGYPSIESLKVISKLFKVSIDDLLSGEELISIAETEQKEKTRKMCDLIYGTLDCMAAILFIFPLFGQHEEGVIRSVSMFELTNLMGYMRFAYIAIVAFMISIGILEMVLQNFKHQMWNQSKTFLSLGLNILGVMVFMVSQQPYASVFLFCMLVIKGILALKQR